MYLVYVYMYVCNLYVIYHISYLLSLLIIIQKFSGSVSWCGKQIVSQWEWRRRWAWEWYVVVVDDDDDGNHYWKQ